MAWTAPSTWLAGAVLTAAKLNEQVRDNLKAIGDPWQPFTPAWTATTTNPAIGNGSLTGAYSQAGAMINFRISLIWGSTTTAGSGRYLMSLPAAPVATYWMFNGALRDASASATYAIMGEIATGSAMSLRTYPSTAGNGMTSLSGATPVTLATGDTLTIHGTYEAAA